MDRRDFLFEAGVGAFLLSLAPWAAAEAHASAAEGKPSGQRFYDRIVALLRQDYLWQDQLETALASRPLLKRLGNRLDAEVVIEALLSALNDRWTRYWSPNNFRPPLFRVNPDQVSDVSVSMLKGDVVYVKIRNFHEGVYHRTALELARHPNARAYILDVRDNQGGLLYEACKMCDLFLDGGPVTTLWRPKPQYCEQVFITRTHIYRSVNGGELEGVERLGNMTGGKPIVVLMNRNTISAPELFTAALVQNNRALAVGETTQGKGVAQKRIELGDSCVLQMTSYFWYTPCGDNIQSRGFNPHYAIAGKKEQEQTAFQLIMEGLSR